MLSHQLYDISLSISNSVNLFLTSFSRTGHPGEFLQWCIIHSRLVVLHPTIVINALYVMSNFGAILSSDSSSFFYSLTVFVLLQKPNFSWVFTAEQKQSTSNFVFWFQVQKDTECVPDDIFGRPVLWSRYLSFCATYYSTEEVSVFGPCCQCSQNLFHERCCWWLPSHKNKPSLTKINCEN